MSHQPEAVYSDAGGTGYARKPAARSVRAVTDCGIRCDDDGAVDWLDYGGMHACFLGPGVGIGTACDCFDLNESGDVDLRDFAMIQSGFSN